MEPSRIASHLPVVLVGVASCLLLAGCATIFGGTSQVISINSNVEGAEVLLDGQAIGTTPFSGQIPKGKDGTILVRKEGYTSQSISLSTSIEPIFWGNILIGGTLGSSTDFGTGALWRYTPATYFANLRPGNASGRLRDRLDQDALVRFFVLHNFARLTGDLARGQGEYLHALLRLLGTDASRDERIVDDLRSVARLTQDAPSLANAVVIVSHSRRFAL